MQRLKLSASIELVSRNGEAIPKIEVIASEVDGWPRGNVNGLVELKRDGEVVASFRGVDIRGWWQGALGSG